MVSFFPDLNDSQRNKKITGAGTEEIRVGNSDKQVGVQTFVHIDRQTGYSSVCGKVGTRNVTGGRDANNENFNSIGCNDLRNFTEFNPSDFHETFPHNVSTLAIVDNV